MSTRNHQGPSAYYPSMPARSSSIIVSSITGFPKVDATMSQVCETLNSDPSRVQQIRNEAIRSLPQTLPPTPEQLDFMQWLDVASMASSNLVADIEAQLAAPISDYLPTELTPAEIADEEHAARHAEGYAMANEATDRLLEDSQALFHEVMDAIDHYSQPQDSSALSQDTGSHTSATRAEHLRNRASTRARIARPNVPSIDVIDIAAATDHQIARANLENAYTDSLAIDVVEELDFCRRIGSGEPSVIDLAVMYDRLSVK